MLQNEKHSSFMAPVNMMTPLTLQNKQTPPHPSLIHSHWTVEVLPLCRRCHLHFLLACLHLQHLPFDPSCQFIPRTHVIWQLKSHQISPEALLWISYHHGSHLQQYPQRSLFFLYCPILTYFSGGVVVGAVSPLPWRQFRLAVQKLRVFVG